MEQRANLKKDVLKCLIFWIPHSEFRI